MGPAGLEGAERTALIVPVPAAERLVAPWRARFDPASAQGVSAHITLLYPFVAPGELDDDVLHRLAATLAGLGACVLELNTVALTGNLVYLDPSDASWFREAQARLAAEWPELLPYEGKYGPHPPPHLTLGYHRPPGPDPTPELPAIRAALAPSLPLSTVLDHVLLTALRDDRWHPVARFELSP